MAVVEDNRGGKKAPVAALDDARKRREQRTDPHLTPSQPEPGGPVEDPSEYALSLADSVRSSDDEPESPVDPHAIPIEHDSTPKATPPLPATFEPEQPTAEDILLALQADGQRVQKRRPTTIPTPDPGPSDEHPLRAASIRSRGRRERMQISTRRAAIACTVIAAAMLVPILATDSNPQRPRTRRHENLVAATTTPATENPNADLNLRTLAAGNYQARARNEDRRDRPGARSRPHSDADARGVDMTQGRITHPVNAQRASITSASTSVSSRQTAATPAAPIASEATSSAQQPANSTPAANPPAASQPAGPTGFGHVVGNNCNPQCN